MEHLCARPYDRDTTVNKQTEKAPGLPGPQTVKHAVTLKPME